jgi:hypothetical protein
MKTQKQAKAVKVISRIEFKSDSRKVVYNVRSSDGTQVYQTCLFNGKACSCTCKATKPCYHMTQLEAREMVRMDAKRAAYVAMFDPHMVAA